MADDSRNADVGARYAQALFDLAQDAGALPAIEADLKTMLPGVLGLDDAAAALACERVIRDYDPCISCATHFLRLNLER